MPKNLVQQYVDINSDPTFSSQLGPSLKLDIYGGVTEEPIQSLPPQQTVAKREPADQGGQLPPQETVATREPAEPPLQVDVYGGQTVVRDTPQDQTYLTNTGPDNQNFGYTRKAPEPVEKELPPTETVAKREPADENKSLPPVEVTADREYDEEVHEELPKEVIKPPPDQAAALPPVTVTAKLPKSVNDWRVKLSLAPQSQKSNYLYNQADPGILAPLKGTNGVIFPYTPQINVSYAASYDQTDLTHSNYRIYQYRGSNVGEISIQADFTAQDTVEANYLLAVIHFFKSATKMFYGKDTDPRPGTPPPLCYLSGYGLYQFNNCPLVISNFSYSLPNDVDYIRAGSATMVAGENFRMDPTNIRSANKTSNSLWSKLVRMANSGVTPGAMQAPPSFNTSPSANENTYVPTKMSITLTCLPIVTRKDVSESFSLREYSKGELWGMW